MTAMGCVCCGGPVESERRKLSLCADCDMDNLVAVEGGAVLLLQ